MSTTVLVTDYSWPSLDIERAILSEAGAELVVADTGTEDELCALAADVDAVMTCWAPVTPAVLRAAPKCRTVARYGVGIDNIAVDVATELGILVSNVPDFCTDEVADHTMALILAQARNITRFDSQTADGGWDNREFGAMHRLRGRVLGLVGYGTIAQAVAVRAVAFGMRIMAYSPSRTRAATDGVAAFAATLDDVLAQADVISLHLPSTDTTRGIIGERELALVKPTAVLINTARGALVDEAALVRALRDARLSGAALDVLGTEPPPPDHPLRARPTAILTPHAAFVSDEAVADLQRTAARNVAAVLRKSLPAALVNPDVLGSPRLRLGTGKAVDR
ncbi:C-terminal binding protein [Streptomyces sp. NBC_01549]|uniref:C-terminal binding protein n=1 Tax=Streptomyces sp. NBC_01549 TaxID=2975874 RepID=UPI00225B4FF8|nr:C-terminal binding protein [Streptomyces sp. NBC_01549]MCX4596732.1 C-terminal binding protein [Streptomyces sp. NBC_01549]